MSFSFATSGNLTAHTYLIYKTPTLLQIPSLYVIGKIRKKKKNSDYPIEYFLSEKFFHGKNYSACMRLMSELLVWPGEHRSLPLLKILCFSGNVAWRPFIRPFEREKVVAKACYYVFSTHTAPYVMLCGCHLIWGKQFIGTYFSQQNEFSLNLTIIREWNSVFLNEGL